MEAESSPSSRIHDVDGDGKIVAAEDSKGEPVVGDVIWVKVSGGSWWPALIVDRLQEDVRVRLYGSYEYMLVNPIKCHSEFQIILEQSNGSYQEIFRKALEQDLSSSKSGRVKGKMDKSKGKSDERVVRERKNQNHVISSSRKRVNKVSTPRKDVKTPKHDNVKQKLKLDNPETEGNSKRKSSKQGEVQKKLNLQISTSDEELSERSPELNARRLKVMQTLGLAAPPGSPFLKITDLSE